MKKITWIHLSDLHIDIVNEFDNSIVRNAFLKDMDSIRDLGVNPDFVVVTGDIANKGKKKEFELAKNFFSDLRSKLGISENRFFLVPGNHDVDCSKITTVNGVEFINELVEGKDNKRINDILKSKLIVLCKDKFANYFKIIDNPSCIIANPNLGNYYCAIEVLDYKIGIVGLNSAWLSRGRGLLENGRLAIGERQLLDMKIVESLEENLFNICLYHHPIQWLLGFDNIRSLLKNKFEFLLCGHFHAPGNSVDVVNNSIEMQAGSLYSTRDYPNGYTIYEYYPESHNVNVKIMLRKYSDNDGGFFTNDNTSYKNMPNGECFFTLNKKKQ